MEIPNPNQVKEEFITWAETSWERTDGNIRLPDRISARAFIEICGGNPEAIKGYEESMKGDSVAANAKAMKAIWGTKYEEFEKINEQFIERYEQRNDAIHLTEIPVYKAHTKPRVVDHYTKQHHMKRMLCLITRYAVFDDSSDPKFKADRFASEIYTRIENGRAKLRGEKLAETTRPDTDEKLKPYVPIEYMPAMIEWLISSSEVK